MNKALYISTQVPSYNSAAGNKTAMDNLVSLSKLYKVDMILICSVSQDVFYNDYENLEIRLIKAYKLSKFTKFLSALINIFSVPPKFGIKLRSNVFNYVRWLTEVNKYSVVFFEFGESIVYIDAVAKPRKIEVSIPDILTQWHLRQVWYIGIFSMAVFRYESMQYKKADTIIVQSAKDRDLFNALFWHKDVRLIHPHISTFVETVQRSPAKLEKFAVLFWGAMNRSENSSGIKWFIDTCWGEVSSRCPGAKLYIVGLNPEKSVLAYRSHNIIITGFVHDPSSYFERAHIGIAPLFKGAGIKVKVLEMLRAGMPVVSTIIGAEGIEPSADLIIADESSFAQEVIDRISDSSYVGG